jgi:hypothetical protein
MKRIFHAGEGSDEPSSEGLIAALGGVLGVLGAFEFWPADFAITGPLGGALGILAGIFFRRGPRRLLLEWRVQNRAFEDAAIARQAAIFLDQLERLPEDAPYEVREELWAAYRNVLREISRPVSSKR